jgi:hypothetical protein
MLCPDAPTVDPIGTDEGRQGDDTGLAEELCHRTDAPDVLLTIDGAEPQAETLGEFIAVRLAQHPGAGIEAMTHIVAIEHRRPDAALR